MSSRFPDNLLAQLEARRYRFDRGEATHILKMLTSLDTARFPDACSLIRFHESLLFLRAFPSGSQRGPQDRETAQQFPRESRSAT